MWLSSNRRENSAKNRVPTTSSDPTPAEDWQSSLPLDWTRLRRTSQGVTSENDVVCCADPASCRHRFSTRPLLSTAELDEVDSDKSNEVRGQAIFCLHDDDPSWIQGYFIARGSTKPWGMLAVQEQIDDCLACSEGGYRRLSLTVYHHRMNPGRRRRENEKPWKIEGIDWTGGDMMSLYHPEFVNMESDILLTVSTSCLLGQ